jgi:hypothetical protein
MPTSVIYSFSNKSEALSILRIKQPFRNLQQTLKQNATGFSWLLSLQFKNTGPTGI